MEFRYDFFELTKNVIVPCEILVRQNPQLVYALVDTGACRSVIDEGLVKRNRWKTKTTDGKITTSITTVNDVRLVSPLAIRLGNIIFDSVEVNVGNLKYFPYDLCIGMDVLSQGNLSIKTSSGSTVLTITVPDDPEE